MKVSNALVALLVISSLIGLVSASCSGTMCSIVCKVINSVYFTLDTIAPTLVILMFIYGGVKYTFSADDPGGRKAGKMTCIHALIGGILIIIGRTFVSTVVTGGCPTGLFIA